jgi:hypothetical protein
MMSIGKWFITLGVVFVLTYLISLLGGCSGSLLFPDGTSLPFQVTYQAPPHPGPGE